MELATRTYDAGEYRLWRMTGRYYLTISGSTKEITKEEALEWYTTLKTGAEPETPEV